MTNFEVDRLEAAFEYLNTELLDRYADLLESDNPERVKYAKRMVERYAFAYQSVKDTLQAFGFLEERDAKLSEESFKDPSNTDHIFAFSVRCKMFDREKYRQSGATAEEAERFLRGHLAFKYCNGLTPEDFEIKLLGQLS